MTNVYLKRIIYVPVGWKDHARCGKTLMMGFVSRERTNTFLAVGRNTRSIKGNKYSQRSFSAPGIIILAYKRSLVNGENLRNSTAGGDLSSFLIRRDCGK